MVNQWSGLILRRLFGPIIQRRGIHINIQSPVVSNTIAATIFWNMYESAELRLMEKYLHPDLPTIELGGSIGILSAFCQKHNKHLLVTVEANPQLAGLQEEHLKRNGADNYRLLNNALGYDADRLFFVPGDSNISGYVSSTWQVGAVEIPTVSLEQIIHSFNLSEFQLICDIEGMEHIMLAKDRNALLQCRSFFVEYHQDSPIGSISISEFTENVKGLGFELIAQDGHCFYFRKPAPAV